MLNGEDKNFESNLEEIKGLSIKLKEPLGGDISLLYHDTEKKKIKYKGGIINQRYEGRGILYDWSGDIIYDGYFQNNEYYGFGNEFEN